MLKSLLLVLNMGFGLFPMVKEATFTPMAAIHKYDYSVKEVKKDQSYPTCRGYMEKYVRENVQFPRNVFHCVFDRTIYFNVTIAPDSTLSDCKPVFGETDSLALACVDCLSSFQGWIPSIRKGKAVETQSLVTIKFASSFSDPYQSIPPEELKAQVPDSLQEMLSTDYFRLGWYNMPQKSASKDAAANYKKAKRFFERALALGHPRALKALGILEQRVGNNEEAEMLFKQFEKLMKEEEDDFDVHTQPEVLPSYPGGPDALFGFLRNTVCYPIWANEHRISGKVLIGFTLNTDGTIECPEVVRSVHPTLDAEAMRVVSRMPSWFPASQNGKLVKVRFYLPINFHF